MKKLVMGLMLLSTSVFAKTYLGGAYNLNDCAGIAGSYGYTLATFGAGYDDRGVYYPYWNACFGSFGSPNPGSSARYHVVPRPGYDLNRCVEDITWEVSGVRCRVVNAAIQCLADIGNKQYQLGRVPCVERVFPYLTRSEDTAAR